MNDSINRKAAIEKVRQLNAIVSPISDDVLLVDKAEVMTELMILPSAEPEETLEEAEEGIDAAFKKLRDARVTVLPSAEPEISRIEKELHGKTPEEQYEFIYWLLFKSFEATAYSNSRLAIIDWLRGEKEDE